MSHDYAKWQRHLFYRKDVLKTTWKLRLSVFLVIVAALVLTRGFWTTRLAQSLVCPDSAVHSDALLLENFDPDYLVFERAEALLRSGMAPRVFVPILGEQEGQPNSVHQGFADVMARIARLPHIEAIPIGEVEPISLNAAKQIRDFLMTAQIRSVIVVAPGFRSRRSALIYDKVLTPAGIAVSCVPVFGTKAPDSWTTTWHGIQEVLEQFLKLQYYRFWVLT